MRKVTKRILAFALSLTFGFTASAQLSKGGTPYSFTNGVQAKSNVQVKSLAKPNMALVAQTDLQNDTKDKPYRVALSFPVNYNVNNSGTWETTPDGGSLWRLRIHMDDAKALSLSFYNFFIPVGGKVFAYNERENHVIGAFTSDYNYDNIIRAIQMLEGETLTLEYYAPSGVTQTPIIEVKEVIYYYRGVNDFVNPYKPVSERVQEKAESCQVDVACTPEISGWEEQRDAVVHYIFPSGGGYAVCTGAMINNTAQDCTPYILSAWHCGEPNAGTNISNWMWYWNYQKATCSPGTANASDPSKGTQTMNGGTVVASSGSGNLLNQPPGTNEVAGSDFYLVELNSTPPTAYNAFYAGWDRTTTASPSGVGIHHPAGSAKKVSTYTSTLGANGNFNGGTANSHWVVQWASTTNGHGVTEGGSSGSPIFNNVGRIVGQLSGGSSFCSAPTQTDVYGKMSLNWTGNGTTANSQLAPWLDPTNSGVTTLDGAYEPCNASAAPVCNIDASSTSITEGESVTFSDLSTGSPTSWAWDFDNTSVGSATPGTSTSQNPGAVTFNTAGTYEVELTATNANGSCTSTVDITVAAPTCDIVASTTSILAGETVTFSDGSTGTPTAWSWNFDNTAQGGVTPSTSTTQNPGAVTYANTGTYEVELTATFASGSCTSTTTINVSQFSGCDTLYNMSDTNSLSLYFTGNGGYISGTNGFGDLAKAEKYSGYAPSTHVTGCEIGIYAESGGNGTLFDVVVWDDNAGLPGTELYRESYDLDALATALAGGLYLVPFEFTNVVNVGGNDFYIGVDMSNYGAGDTIGIATNYYTVTVPSNAYEQYSDGTWHTIEEYWGYTFSMSIKPYMTDMPVTGSATANTTTGCTGSTITFSATGTNVNDYEWYFPSGTPATSTNASEDVSYSAPGNYTAYVYLNGSSCSGTLLDSVEVTVVDGPSISTTSSDPSCVGTDGEIIATGTGGTGSYQYQIDGGTLQPSGTFSNLSDGSYDVTVVDGNGCEATETVVVNPGAGTLTVSGATSDPSCLNNDGQIVVSATGGVAAYDYSIDGGTTLDPNDTYTGLSSGTYVLVAEDQNGCQGTTTVTLNPATSSVTGAATTTDPICTASNGEIAMVGSGGTGPYEFSLDGTNFQTTDFTGLADGSYTVTIQDDLGCTGTISATLTASSTVLTATTNVTDPSCSVNDGIIDVTPTNGTAAYNYSIDGGTNFQTNASFTGLAVGTYSILIEDANGCQGTVSATLVNSAAPSMTSTPVDASCNGVADGSISIAATGGNPGYEYSIDGVNFGTSSTFSSLTAGSYTVYVSDNSGCESSETVVIGEPTAITNTVNVTDASCGNSNGVVDATATGGQSPYLYSLNGGTGQSTGSFSSLASGSYTIQVTDNAGCQSAMTTHTVGGTSGPTITPTVTNETCMDANGGITISATGGTAPLTYSNDGGATTQPGNAFNGLSAGNYSVVVTDAAGCSSNTTVTVTNTGGFTLLVNPASGQTICDGNSANISASGAGAGATYTWNQGLPAGASHIVSPTVNTVYSVDAEDAFGCVESGSVSITVETAPTVTVLPSNPTICSGETIDLTATGAQSYVWNSGVTTPTISVSPTSQTSYFVIGQNGACAGSQVQVTVSVDPSPTVVASSNVTNIPVGGTVDFNNAGSSATSYNWNFGDGQSSTQGFVSHTYNVQGTYTVTLTGTIGNCTETDVITIVVGNPTSVDQVDLENAVSLYPNPNNGQFNLKLDFGLSQDVTVMLFSTIGQLVESKDLGNVSSTNVMFDLSGKAEGVYFVQINTSAGTVTKRVTVTK